MADRTVVQRVKNQRDVRLTEGWQEVRVWVPSDQDAENVRNLAAKLRAKAEALDGLSREVPSVSPQTEARIAKAIADHGSAAYNTPSGAVLDLMTALANEDNLRGLSRAVVILARAKPANAKFVIDKVPAKVASFLVNHRGVSSDAHYKWSLANPSWADDLKNSARDPERFASVVEAMAKSVRAYAQSH